MNEFWLILGMFVITFGIRFVMFAFAGKITFPVWLQQSLKFVPPAVLTAIIVPSVVMPLGEIDVSFNNAYLIAAIISVMINKNTTTNRIGIKCVPNQVLLNLTPGIKLTIFKTIGSKVRPSRYITKKKAVNTTNVPASG